MSDSQTTKDAKFYATQIAMKIAFMVRDQERKWEDEAIADLTDLLTDFASEIQRSAIEP